VRLAAELSLDYRPVVYRENGLRAFSLQETYAAIERLLTRYDLEIGYEQTTKPGTGLFASIVYWLPKDGSSPSEWYSGKGLTGRQAFVSAFLELVERFSARRRPDDPVHEAPYEAVRGTAADPHRFLLPSTSQYSPQRPLDWVWGWSLTRPSAVLVPANLVFLPYDPPDKGKRIAGVDSSGLASGNCLEEAILHALFEVIERDTAFIVEYNRLALPDVVLDGVHDQALAAHLETIREADIACHIKDARLDLGFPAFGVFIEAAGADPPACAQAYGLHLDTQIALSRAVTEAVQLYPESKNQADWLASGPLDYYRAGSGRVTRFGEVPDLATDNLRSCVDRCVDLLRQREIEVIVVDLTLPGLSFPTVRVLAPGLQPYTMRRAPRLSERLLCVPVALGYRKQLGIFADLKPRAICGYGE